MKKQYILLLLFTGISFFGFSQQFIYQAGVHSFFDNTEFGSSTAQVSQTMAGVHLVPQIGLSWQQKHRAFVGIDVMHEFGSAEKVEFYDPIAYYQFDGERFLFNMGAFPRTVLENYPRILFRDSINNYRPTLNGLFWQYNAKANENYINVWLDWTGRQTEKQNEAFFMGWSGRYNYGVLYGQHFGYMFHFAKKLNPIIEEAIHDNAMTLTSIGVDFAKKTSFEKLELNVGLAFGIERDREIGDWEKHPGFLSEIKIEYKGIGLFNTLYLGKKQQQYFDDHSTNLYWGDSMYRLKQYNRTDLYIRFFKTEVVNVKFMFSLHFAESNMYSEQSLYATFDLNNLPKKEHKPYEYIWSNWFK